MEVSRTRTVNKLKSLSLLRRDLNPNGTVGTNWRPVGSTSISGSQHTMQDNLNPGFRQRQKRGEVILSECSLLKYEYEAESCKITLGHHPDWGSIEYDGCFLGSQMGAQGAWFDTMSDAAQLKTIHLIKAYAKMNESPVMGGEILADLGKTVSMLRRPFASAQDLLNRMAKAKSRRPSKTNQQILKANADVWLEYRYGWKPLIIDAATLCNEAENSTVKGFRSRAVARSGGEAFKKETRASGISTAGQIVSTSWLVTETYSSKVNAGVIYSIANRSGAALKAKTLGLDARSVLPTLWETVPYSFVVDWFVNVGDWLQAVVPDPYINVYGNWITQINKCVMAYSTGLMTITVGSGQNVRTYTGVVPAGKFTTTHYVRTCKNPISLTPTVLGKPLSMVNSVDSLALSLQNIKSGLRGFKH